MVSRASYGISRRVPSLVIMYKGQKMCKRTYSLVYILVATPTGMFGKQLLSVLPHNDPLYIDYNITANIVPHTQYPRLLEVFA